jgi:hypothetical protein
MNGTDLTGPERTRMSHLDQINISTYIYSSNNSNDNVYKKGKGKGRANDRPL